MENAFICDRNTFTYIYKLEKRRSDRGWYNCYLFHIKVNSADNKNLKKASGRMYDILSTELRRGDTVCRWDSNHFLMILYNIDDDNSTRVMDRISHRYFEFDASFNSGIDIDMDYRRLA